MAAEKPAPASHEAKQVLQKRIDIAVKKAVDWLRKKQVKDGPEKGAIITSKCLHFKSGVTAIALFAMLRMGVKISDPMMEEGFRYLIRNAVYEPKTYEYNTYNHAVRILAFSEGFSEMLKSRKPKGAFETSLLSTFQKDFDHCKKAISPGEAGYQPTEDRGGDVDLSNTQFVIMALEAAHRLGYRLPSEAWIKMLDCCLKRQSKDGPVVKQVNILSPKGAEVDSHGYVIRDRYHFVTIREAKARGWSYCDYCMKDETYGSMTAAGVSNLLSCLYVLEKDAEFKRNWKKRLEDGIRDGFAWLQKYYAVNVNPTEPEYWFANQPIRGSSCFRNYHLFTLARITRVSDICFIGSHNWYKEGVNHLIHSQYPDGHWDILTYDIAGGVEADLFSISNTAYALWFFSSLDQRRVPNTVDEIGAIRKESPVSSEEALEREVLSLVWQHHTEKSHWDADVPLVGSADLLAGLASRPAFEREKEDKRIKAGISHLKKSILPQKTMAGALKALRKQKKVPRLDKRYGEHLLYERWRTSTLTRTILALVHSGMSTKEWDTIANLQPGARVRVAKSVKKYVSPMAAQLLLYRKRIGKSQCGWTESCGRPDHLQPDALSTSWALRGLHAAKLCGISAKPSIWVGAARFLLSTQEAKGVSVELLDGDGKKTGRQVQAMGFGHLPGDPADAVTTMEVMSSLHLCLLHGKLDEANQKSVRSAIDSGQAWLQAHYPGPYTFQHLLSLKRLGGLSCRKVIGKGDWRLEGRRFLTYQVKQRGFHPWTAGMRLGCALYFLGRRGM